MTKRAITAMVVAAVISVSGLVPAFAEETPEDNRPRGHFGFGAGLGLRYGLGGLGIEASPTEYLAFTAGVGFLGIAAGYSAGVQVFPLGRASRLRPWVSFTGGKAVGGTGYGIGEANFAALGIGGEVGFGPDHTFEFGIDFANGTHNKFVYPTLGYKKHF